MGFIKGAEAAEEKEKAAQAARKAAWAADRLDYLSIGDGDQEYLRLITPASEWITVAQHSFVQVKPKPEGVSNWPRSMGGVCRHDPQVKELLGTEDCYICDKQLKSAFRKDQFARPSNRTWAIAALRQRVIGDGSEERGGEEKRGQLVGYDDVREEYEIKDAEGKPTGRKAERIKFVLVNMTWSSIFATLNHAQKNYMGGVCGRDFMISREGEGTDTKYSVISMDPIEGLAPGQPAWSRYTDELARRKIVLDELVLQQASDEHYARWFDPTKAVDKDGKIVPVTGNGSAAHANGSGSTPPEAAGPLDAAEQAKLADLRSRLGG